MQLSQIEYTSIHKIKKMLNSIFYGNTFSFLENYGFNLILMNILIYISSLTILFFIFFLFNLDNFSSLNNLKIFANSNFFFMIVIFSLLSLVGMPPLLGFVGKFLLVILINLKSHFFFLLFFILTNLFMIYFYIQNFRFLVKKSNTNSYSGLFLFNELNFSVIKIISFIFFFNIFGIFIFDDFFLILNSLLLF